MIYPGYSGVYEQFTLIDRHIFLYTGIDSIFNENFIHFPTQIIAAQEPIYELCPGPLQS